MEKPGISLCFAKFVPQEMALLELKCNVNLNPSIFWSFPSDISLPVASFFITITLKSYLWTCCPHRWNANASTCLVTRNQLTGYFNHITLVLPALSFKRKWKSPNKTATSYIHMFRLTVKPKFYIRIPPFTYIIQDIINSLSNRFLICQMVITEFTLLGYYNS